MRHEEIGTHDGLVLDDVRDLRFLVRHQEKLQGKYDAMVEFASTPGSQLAYEKDERGLAFLSGVRKSSGTAKAPCTSR